MARFSLFLAERHPSVVDVDRHHPRPCSRTTCRGWRPSPLGDQHPVTTPSPSSAVFLDGATATARLPGLPADAVIYDEEVTRPPRSARPQFIPEFVMNQLESDANLDRLPNPTVRHLVVVLIETGLRGGDACVLAFNPIVDDSAGWPCLRFDNTKVRAEQLIPLERQGRRQRSAPNKTTSASAGRRARRGCSPASSTTPTAPSPTPTAALCQQLGRWQSVHRRARRSRPASAGHTPTSSATPSAPGSSTPASPSTSSRSCSATPAPA